MSKIISGSAPRLVFAIVDGTTGAAITDAVAADISSRGYQTIGPRGQFSAVTTVEGTLSTVAKTASVIAGSFGAIDASQGLYFVDFPALAALDAAHSVQAVIELVSGDNLALAVVHEIDAKVSSRAIAGDQMDLIDTPNSTAIAAIQDGLSTFDVSTDLVDVGSIETIDAADYFAAMLSAITTPLAAVAANVSTILGKWSGVTSFRAWIGAVVGKTADSTTLAEINATDAGASYNNVTGSLETTADKLTTERLAGMDATLKTGNTYRYSNADESHDVAIDEVP